MRSRRKPFQQGKSTPTLVVQQESGSLWLAAKGYISPNTNPIELQEKQKKQAQVSLLVLEAADALAKAKGIQPSEARKLFFPKPVKAEVKAEGSDKKDAIVQVEAEEIFDWLDTEQKTLYFSLSQEAADIPIKVATMMMQHRLLYQIEVTEAARAKSRNLSIVEPWFDLQVGDRLSVEAKPAPILVKVVALYDESSGSIEVEPLSAEIPADSVGFLLEGNTYAIGDPSWTEADTLNLSIECADQSTSQIDAINRFYLKECGRLVDDPIEDKPRADKSNAEDQAKGGNAPETIDNHSETTSVPLSLTGVNSIGEFNPTVSGTIDSPMKILETAPTG